jgi:hypothetical protein
VKSAGFLAMRADRRLHAPALSRVATADKSDLLIPTGADDDSLSVTRGIPKSAKV